MKCIECGHELKDGAIFCIRCGAMQVSMDGKPIDRGQDWPEVDAQSGTSGFRSSTEGALHSAQSKNPRGFQQPPKRNVGRIVAAIIAIVALIAIVAFAVTQCAAPATSGSDAASSAESTSTSSEAASTSSASSTSSESASSASDSASASSASASAASGSSADTAASTTTGGQAEQNTSTTTVQQPAPEPEPEPAPAPAPEPAPSRDYYVLGDSSSHYYSYDELSGMSTYDLYLARNEIYARHGRMFNRSDLQDYFDSQAWYEPLYSPSQFDSMGQQLSDVELQNAKLMKQVEADKGSPYL